VNARTAAVGILDRWLVAVRRPQFEARLQQPGHAHHTLPYVQPYGTGGRVWNALRSYPTLGIAIMGMSKHLYVALRRLLQFCRAGLEPGSAIRGPREGEAFQ
jgi:hypothetical protein